MNMTWNAETINRFNLEAIFVTVEETYLYLTKLNYS